MNRGTIDPPIADMIKTRKPEIVLACCFVEQADTTIIPMPAAAADADIVTINQNAILSEISTL